MEEEKDVIIENTNANKDLDETAKQIEELKKTQNDLIEQLKTEREAKNIYKEQLEKKDEPKVPEEDSKIVEVVRSVLNEDKVAKAKANKTAAFEKFVTENKDFHPDNDPTGLKREALKNAFNRFNTEGMFSVEEFVSVVRDAYRLLGGNDTNPETLMGEKNPYSSTIISPKAPTTIVDEDLTSVEKKFLEKNPSWTKERLLKVKSRNPEVLEDLFKFVRV